jgi:hypothetical protein
MLAGLGAQAALAVAERQGAALQARFAARRDNAADATRLREAAPRIADAEALLKDRRALTLVLEAFQLESEIGKRAMLRRVLTEDPADEKSLVNRLADPRWRELANAFAARREVALTPAQIAAQTVDQLRAMPLNQMAGLDALQVRALSAAQVAALDPRQVAALAPEALGGLDLVDVTALTKAQMAALDPAQLAALNPAQIMAIEPGDFAALGTAQLRALNGAQIAVLKPAQLAALGPDQVAAFTAVQARAFGAAQLNALGEGGRALLAAAPFLPAEEPARAARGPLADGALVERIIERAMVNRYEKAMGEANAGMREALYFRRVAGGITSLNALMSDRAALEVVRGALGLPKSFAALEFEQQRDTLARRLDLSDLQDPEAVRKMVQRYLSQVAPRESSNPVMALFDSSGRAGGIAALVGARISFSA